VLEHLNRKWGDSDVACGELVLLPYTANIGDLRSCQRWTLKDTVVATDVFASVGSPAVFRLRFTHFMFVLGYFVFPIPFLASFCLVILGFFN
jgi:hypothetical protein